MDKQGVIGVNGGIPWRLSDDLKHFKAITMGKPIVMGRKTHATIGRLLPGRENIIITRRTDYHPEGCTVLNNLEALYDRYNSVAELMIMGGAELYQQTLEISYRIYLTEVHTEVIGDVFFPEFDRSEWQEIEREDFQANEKNEYPFSFVVLQRKQL